MNKLDNLTAIAQPITETQAETINGGRSLADIGRQVSGATTENRNGGVTEQELLQLKRAQKKKRKERKRRTNRQTR